MLSPKEIQQLDTFRKGLQMPAWQFVLRKGVLAWGISTALLYTFVSLFTQAKSWDKVVQKDIWINLLMFMLGGIFFGILLRGFISRQVKKLEEKRDLPE